MLAIQIRIFWRPSRFVNLNAIAGGQR